MTREERLSLAIARHCEKEPTFDLPTAADEIVSRGGCWRCSHLTERLIMPRSITEPEIAMRLLKWLIENDYRLHPAFRWQEEARYLHEFKIMDFDGDYFAGNERVELAIGEAFAKAFNLEV